MLQAMDRGVGEMLNALDATGQASNTIVWFTGDNGGSPISRNAGLKGGKGSPWEGGIRVREFVRWPGHIPAGPVVGRTHVIDVMPTVLDALDVVAARPMDGRSILPSLTTGAAIPARKMFWSANGNHAFAMIDGRWKLVRIGGFNYLYDLVSDPHETVNKAGYVAQQTRVRQMNAEIDAWRLRVR